MALAAFTNALCSAWQTGRLRVDLDLRLALARALAKKDLRKIMHCLRCLCWAGRSVWRVCAKPLSKMTRVQSSRFFEENNTFSVIFVAYVGCKHKIHDASDAFCKRMII